MLREHFCRVFSAEIGQTYPKRVRPERKHVQPLRGKTLSDDMNNDAYDYADARLKKTHPFQITS